MNQILYCRSVSFRDENKNRFTVDFEVRKCECQKRNRRTLEMFDEHFEISVCGEGAGSMGQCDGHIKPRTETQKELLEFWEKYHLCGVRAGTVTQEEYLLSKHYEEDYKCFINLFAGYDDNFRKDFDTTSENILYKAFNVEVRYIPTLRTVIAKYLGGNPIKYILGIPPYRSGCDMNDLYVKYLFLAIRGLYNDRGYEYGKGWLFDPIPENVCQMIDGICDRIECEEAELTKSLTPLFDMGSEEFEPTPEVIEYVVKLRDCDEDEAKRFIALGMHLGYTFGDLNDTFKEVDDENQMYSVNGTEYYVGTEDELTEIAERYVYDGDYDHLWREAVAARKTEQSLNDWLNDVIQCDGWCNILNKYDGKYEEYTIGDDNICVSRS